MQKIKNSIEIYVHIFEKVSGIVQGKYLKIHFKVSS